MQRIVLPRPWGANPSPNRGVTTATISSKHPFYNMMLRMDSPKDSADGNGPGFCADQPRFVGWELEGAGEYSVLNSKRVVVPIHCE